MPGETRRGRTAPLTRRDVLRWSLLGGVVVIGGGIGGLELVSHNILPGKQSLDELDGACSPNEPAASFGPLGHEVSGSFYSRARRRTVGYTIAYPAGVRAGEQLPLVVALHGYGVDHQAAFRELRLQQFLALRDGTDSIRKMAIVSADGGNGYWHAHPNDDPLSMLEHELIPRCQALGLGHAEHGIAAYGWSMGAYGAILLAERSPGLLAAVAATSPAVWTTYAQAHGANPGAYSSPAEFADNDVITHAGALAAVPLRIDSGNDDPFAPGVRQLIAALPAGKIAVIAKGCHDDQFMRGVAPQAFRFLASQLK